MTTTIRIAKTHDLAIDTSKFTDEVNAFVFAYGLKQLLNDAGSSGKDADEKLAMAQKKLDALYAGTLRTARGGSAKAAIDPVQAEAERLARADIAKMLKAGGRKLGDVDADKLATAIEAHLRRNPEILKTAKARVDALGKAKTVAVDLGDLGL